MLLSILYCRFSYDCNSLSKNEITRSLGGIMIIRDFSCICGCWFPVRSDVITMYSARIPALPELTLI